MRAGLVSNDLWKSSAGYHSKVFAVPTSHSLFFLTVGAQSEVDYTEQLNFSDDDEQGSNQKEHDSRSGCLCACILGN